MIAQILERLSTVLEGAGLRWGSSTGAWVLDGSSSTKRVTWEPADADHPRGDNLKVGIAWQVPFVPRQWLPPFGVAKTRDLDLVAGTLQQEAAAPNVARILRVHLYMKETRPDAARFGFDLPTLYARNEGRIIAAFGGVLGQARYDTANVEDQNGVFVPRTYGYGFDGAEFQSTAGLEIHGVYRCRVEYPIVESLELTPGFLAKRVILGRDLDPDQFPLIPQQTAVPLTLPAPGKTSII